MSRLIVVSNRVNPPPAADQTDGEGSVGGLVMALAAALREYSGVWFGWSGKTTPTFTGQLSMQRVNGVTTATVDLEDGDYQEYYNGYANKTLWPLFHYRVDLTAYDRSFGEGYDRVNKRFAETLLPLIEPDDVIWVHDYHLIPMARELRRMGVTNRIGFFLHIPWPAHQLVVTLPRHRPLVEAMFDYDLIGFQTEENRHAFEGYVTSEVGGSAGPGQILSAFGKTTRAAVFPIGIDAADFARITDSPRARKVYDRMLAHSVFRKMVVGVDRLDYSKGLEERLVGFERFLHDNPDQRSQVMLLQIAPISRDEVEAYQDLRSRLDGLIGRINGAYAEMDFTPIRYVNRSYRRDELAGVYRAARVGLVTPLRDGMNLVAKEYVAAQDPNDPGVLILSRFAGAARQLTEALIINPNSPEEISDALSRALSMGPGERRQRWDSLNHTVQKQDVTSWRDDFVQALTHPAAAAAVAASKGMRIASVR